MSREVIFKKEYTIEELGEIEHELYTFEQFDETCVIEVKITKSNK
jgi:hypothetical protein